MGGLAGWALWSRRFAKILSFFHENSETGGALTLWRRRGSGTSARNWGGAGGVLALLLELRVEGRHAAAVELERISEALARLLPHSLYSAATDSERIAFHMLNKETGNRLKQQYVDVETGDVVERDARSPV